MFRLVTLLLAAAGVARADVCCEAAQRAGVYEQTEDCCRLVAPAGPTALTEQQNCSMLPGAAR